MKKQKKPHQKKIKLYLLLTLLAVLGLGLTFQLIFNNRIYPGISLANIDLTALTIDQAQEKSQAQLKNRTNTILNFSYQDSPLTLTIDPSDFKIDTNSQIEKAFLLGRSKLYYKTVNLRSDVEFKESFEQKLTKLASKINQSALDSQIKLDGDQILVTPSSDGLILDEGEMKKIVAEFINSGKIQDNNLPTKKVTPKLDYQTALEIKKTLDQIKINPLKLEYENKSWLIDLPKAINLINLEPKSSQNPLIKIDDLSFSINSINYSDKNIAEKSFVFDPQKLKNYLSSIEKEINRPVQEPLFNFDGQKVTEFQAPIEGRSLNLDSSVNLINQAQLNKESTVYLAVDVVPPKNKLVNDLGIKELIGRGISNFKGSIENRIFNIGLASSRINGVLIAPGEVFSFNKTVGDISAESGYKQAYVIKSGRTVLDDGGGVCQVSTTLFRAVLNSGMPVVERVAHAYRVGYYELGFPPGLDATIFHPSVDFKFKNDSERHILIQAYVSGLSLYVDFFGTSDGRLAKITTPVVTDKIPPPPELRQDDPSLPKGTVKQVDFAASGANVEFKRTVEKNGKVIINDTFKSNYRPWQAVYLVGTGG